MSDKPPADVAGLVERLRGYCIPMPGMHELTTDAADALTRLAAENDWLKVRNEELRMGYRYEEANSKNLAAERDALREALEECESVLRRIGCDMTADIARAALARAKEGA